MTMTMTRRSSNSIDNPIRRGTTVRIPAGTLVRSMNPKHKAPRVTKRATTVTVHHASPGYIDHYGDRGLGAGLVVLPTITWPGEAGYWQDVQVTPELCEALGLPVPALPDLTPYELGRLDTIPSYGPGYDNREFATSY